MNFVFSYHFNSDREFVGWMAEKLALNGIDSWFLDNLDNPKIPPIFNTIKDDRYEDDWRIKQQNWQAAWLDHISEAKGAIIVSSEQSIDSQKNPGRGMWREFDAISYIYEDNPLRIIKIEKSDFYPIESLKTEQLLKEIILWAQTIIKLPPVKRIEMDDYGGPGSSWNLREGLGFGIYPEIKTKSNIWYELIRLDLYDVQWICRKCCLKSSNYIFGEETAPRKCPRCSFSGHPEHGEGETQLSSQEIEFLKKIEKTLADFKENRIK